MENHDCTHSKRVDFLVEWWGFVEQVATAQSTYARDLAAILQIEKIQAEIVAPRLERSGLKRNVDQLIRKLHRPVIGEKRSNQS